MLKLKLINSPKPLKIKFNYNFPEVLPVVLEEKTITPKIVDQIIIPSSNYDGMSQVTVKAVNSTIDKNIKSENIKKDISILGVEGNVEELNGTKLEITKNGIYTPEEPYNAFTEVDVNMESVDDYFTSDIKNQNIIEILKSIPLLHITTTWLAALFKGCKSLETIPLLDTHAVKSMYMMFEDCNKLTHVPLLDMTANESIRYMFHNCISLTSIPQFNTSNVTNIQGVFSGCIHLTDVPLLNCSKVTFVNGEIFDSCSRLINIGGLQNLGQAYLTTQSANSSDYYLSLVDNKQLTHDSLMNVINNLYDIATKGVKTQQLILGSTNIAKLTAEEIAIATNKGWTVS